MALLSLLFFVFVTTVFVLYIYFCKEPEIRATSVTVSLSMFLGCYILMLYLPLLAIGRPHDGDYIYCNIIIWLGLALPLITTTLFAKMLRIYLIFCDPLSYKKKFFSDPFLFLYILLLMAPSISILLLWTASDPYKGYIVEFPQENFVFIRSICHSNYTFYWLGAYLFY